MAWYEKAAFYHIYPLGLCGCAKENDGTAESHFPQLKQWAEHVKKLGFTAIYIGPLFESVGHGYETTDYRKVDCRLGTNEEFKEYVDACHEMGLRVIVDGVFNHVGRRFFAFEDLKKNREGSAYKDWFCDVNFWNNNEYDDGFSYANWGGYNLLVKLNQRNPQVKDYMYDVIRFWIHEFNIDGIRLDAADVLDYDFMAGMRNVCDQEKEEFWLMGEVIHGNYSMWANERMLHSVTNYELHKALYSGHNDHNYFEIAHTVQRSLQMNGNLRLYSFVDNHDVERIATKLTNKAHLFSVHLLLYGLPGIPSTYYGSEFGIEGRKEKGSDASLRPALQLSDFAGAEQSNALTKLIVRLNELKKEYEELSFGRYEQLLLSNRQYAFGRFYEQSAVVIAANNDDSDADLWIRLPMECEYQIDLLKNQFGETPIRMESGHLVVHLEANRGTFIYLTNDKDAARRAASTAQPADASTEPIVTVSEKPVSEQQREAVPERLAQQMAFALELDKEKRINRQTYLSGEIRKENDAEHAWHLALMTMLLSEYSNDNIDVLRTMAMVILHDVVEIDAGDTFAYDAEGHKSKKQRETAAAERIFNLLPEDQAEKFRGLWDEFEEAASSEARFAHAMDSVQPIMLNHATNGRAWREHGVQAEQVKQRAEHMIKPGSDVLYKYVQGLIEENQTKGNLKK